MIVNGVGAVIKTYVPKEVFCNHPTVSAKLHVLLHTLNSALVVIAGLYLTQIPAWSILVSF
jgi:hypothetical protein